MDNTSISINDAVKFEGYSFERKLYGNTNGLPEYKLNDLGVGYEFMCDLQSQHRVILFIKNGDYWYKFRDNGVMPDIEKERKKYEQG